MARGEGRTRTATTPPVEPERLGVLLHQRPVAVLERSADGHLRLTYLPTAERALSLALPVRAEPYEDAQLLPFFEGLLPEGRVRDQLATRFRIEPADVFGLLREFGRECAGAVTVLPEAESAAPAARDVRWLSDEELAERIAEVEVRPFADEPSENVRISLAGTQSKLVVVIGPEGQVGLPRGATPSTHILKPQSKIRRGKRLAYPDIVANEAFCMRLAAGAGLSTAEVGIRKVAGESVLVVRRYDRTPDGGRLHQEDFCQALGIPSRLKYEADGGPGQLQYLELLARHSAYPLEDRAALLDRIAYCYLIANDDMHAKNFAVLYTPAVRLAPAYDLLSTRVYPHLKREMGTAVNRMYDAEQLRAVHWRKHFGQVGISEALFAARLGELAGRVESALPVARAQIERWGIASDTIDKIGAIIQRRAKRLAELAA